MKQNEGITLTSGKTVQARQEKIFPFRLGQNGPWGWSRSRIIGNRLAIHGGKDTPRVLDTEILDDSPQISPGMMNGLIPLDSFQHLQPGFLQEIFHFHALPANTEYPIPGRLLGLAQPFHQTMPIFMLSRIAVPPRHIHLPWLVPGRR
ncbi:MAG TPA: hypothetical protein PK360_06725 [bacterium]|nr:hypothetical protein [bacterium]